jgi:glycosyltransferase involved in cell wall biosynthesis
VKASNYGAEQAKGKYLLFAQCDDYAEPTQIERLMEIFELDKRIGVVYSRSNLIDEKGNYISNDFIGREKKFKEKHAKNSYISGIEMRNYLSFSCVIPNLSAAIIKKDLYFEAGRLPEKFLLAADWALWLELSERTGFYYLTECLNNFRQHSTTIRSKTKIRIHINEIYSIFYNHIKTYKLSATEIKKMKIGAGAIWFAYFIENPKIWIKDFPNMFTDQWKHDRLSMIYLGLGILKQVRNFLVK